MWVAFALVAFTASAFTPRPISARGVVKVREAGPRRRGQTVVMAADNKPKWASPINEFFERIESTKALALGAVAGSVALAPVDLLFHLGNIPQWEFDTDSGALACGLFAVVYRYAVREDNNPNLKQGVVGAFAITRALAFVQPPEGICDALPLRCGPPFSYFSYEMLEQLIPGALESGVMFAATAAAFEAAAERGWVKKFPSSG